MKDPMESNHIAAELKRLDATSLKKRAAEDAVKDAESYASATRYRQSTETKAKESGPLAELLGAKQAQVKAGSQDGIDGLVIHANEDDPRLVLTSELLEISLVEEAEALETEPMTIFHVQAPAPWVEYVRAGKA